MDTLNATVRSDLGYLFDVDGVLTPTAILHQQAWKELFDAVLDEPFTEADYLSYVDGRSRHSGVATTLRSRGISPTDAQIAELAQTKNDLFLAVVSEHGVTPYPDAAAVTADLVRVGAPMAVVSSSRNARMVLDAAELSDRFTGWVDGEVALKENLAGKPDPAMFERAAAQLNIAPEHCVVIEDAEAGVAAGAAGNFALVVGVDRTDQATSLLEAGADVVINDLRDLWIVTSDLPPGRDRGGPHAG